MFDFLKNRGVQKRPEQVLVLDLGTSSVKVVACDLTTFTPTPLGFGRANYSLGTVLSGLVADWAEFLKTVNEAIRQATIACGFVPRDLFYSLSGEFCKAATFNLRVVRGEIGLIKAAEVKAIRQEIDRLLQQAVEGDWARVTGKDLKNVRVVSRRLEAIVNRDGVLLEDLTSVVEPEFILTATATYLAEDSRKLLSQLARDLKRRLWRQEAQVVGILPQAKRRPELWLDFGGQVSDVALVSQGRLVGVATLPMGSADFTTAAAEQLRMSWSAGEEAKLRGEVASQAFGEAAFFWLAGIEAAVKNLLAGEQPESFDLYLWGGGSQLSCFTELWDSFLKAHPASLLARLRRQDLPASSATPEIDDKELFRPVWSHVLTLNQNAENQF